MRRILVAFVFVLIALAVQNARAQSGKNLYVITHVDIAAPAGKLDEAINLLREFVADSQKDPGVVRFELLQQNNRRNHFTIVEVWQSESAFEAHSSAEHTKRFREKIQPVLGSPFDERLHSLLQ